MTPELSKLLFGLSVMAVCCGVAAWRGDRMVRLTVLLVVACWLGSAMAQLALGRRLEPVIAADVVCGIGLLLLAVRGGAAWQWILVALQSVVIILHAMLYELHAPASPLERLGNNVLVTLGLVVLVGASLLGRRPAPAAAQPSTRQADG